LVVTPPPVSQSARATSPATPSGRFGAAPVTPGGLRAQPVPQGGAIRRCPKCKAAYPLGLNICPRDGTQTVLEMGGQMEDPLSGVRAGNYRITAKIGEGGMGGVYTADHVSLGKKVAIKVLHREYAQSPALIERFFEEARAASQLGHEHIVDIHDFGILEK